MINGQVGIPACRSQKMLHLLALLTKRNYSGLLLPDVPVRPVYLKSSLRVVTIVLE